MKKRGIGIIILIVVIVAIVGYFVFNNLNLESRDVGKGEGEPKLYPASSDLGGFCGFSTKGSCSSDSDCSIGGCSRSVCMATSELDEGFITTCEFKECYIAQDYEVSCGCVNNKCQWYK